PALSGARALRRECGLEAAIQGKLGQDAERQPAAGGGSTKDAADPATGQAALVPREEDDRSRAGEGQSGAARGDLSCRAGECLLFPNPPCELRISCDSVYTPWKTA